WPSRRPSGSAGGASGRDSAMQPDQAPAADPRHEVPCGSGEPMPSLSSRLVGLSEPIRPCAIGCAQAARRHTVRGVPPELLAGLGLAVLKPIADGPDFDLAWESQANVFVAEIKSTTDANETKQLRLGLAQVLDYADRLSQYGKPVRAVMVVERKPADM